MSWNRNKSVSEQLMVNVLAEAKQALSLDEIVSVILASNSSALAGKTPKNSLYSVIYRREKRRAECGLEVLFITSKRGGATYYSLNANGLESIGERILEK
jgi:hypothetical protein